MTRLTKLLLFLIAILVSPLLSPVARAKTINAASCNVSDVQAAVNSAKNGDTVIIPSCPSGVTWTTTLSYSVGITLIGQGAGNTVITDGTSKGDSSCSGVESLISVSLSTNVFVRISGFTVIGKLALNNCGESSNHIHIDGFSHQARVDNITFNPLGVTGITTTGDTWGVIDHNTFIENAANQKFSVLVQHNSWGGVGNYGDNSWAQPDTLGQAGAVYLEDNTFSFPSGVNVLDCVDSEAGGRLVFRHNNGCPTIAFHGMDSSGRLRSVRQWEIYDNNFPGTASQPLGNLFTGVFLRGGTGVIWGNNFQDGASNPFLNMAELTYYRDTDAYAPWAGPTAQNGSTAWGANGCDGNSPYDTNDGGGRSSTVYQSGTASASSATDNMTANGSPGWTANQWVGYSIRNVTEGWGGIISSNTSTTITTTPQRQGSSSDPSHTWRANDTFLILHAYPCLDQTGRGMGKLFQNADPVLAATGQAGAASQAIDPVYDWLNTHNGGTNYWSTITASPERIQANRDYYGYATNFNGTSGTGSGLLSARPATCTPLVAYWATDTNTLYQCTSTDTWSAYYTPYTYPHPLIQGSGSLPPGPAPPTGLAIAVH